MGGGLFRFHIPTVGHLAKVTHNESQVPPNPHHWQLHISIHSPGPLGLSCISPCLILPPIPHHFFSPTQEPPSIFLPLLFGQLEGMVIPSVSALNFVSVTPSMGILFPLLRRIEVLTFWSFFLSFMCFANCILGILSFWAKAYQ